MSELNKRVFTSLILILISIISFYNNIFLFFVLICCLYQIFYEASMILKKIFRKNNIKLLFSLIFTLIFLTYLILFIWISLYSGNKFDKLFLILLISISISSDIGGYIFGKLFKGKKLTSISPNKTFSGMYGSFILSLITIFVIFKDFINNFDLILIIILISLVTQIGDLFISYLKRKSNLKDTGNLLPGHGGLLDRFDGLIFSITLGSIIKLLI